jgi:hypothetical protein
MATKKRASRKKPASKASKYIREEMREVGKGNVKSRKQAVAIGLSRARRAGEDVPAPAKGKAPAATRKRAQKDIAAGRKRAVKKAASKKRATKKAVAAKKRAGAKRR